MTNQEIMPTLNFEEHHSKIGYYLKTGRLAIEHKGGAYFNFEIEIEKDFDIVCDCGCEDDGEDCTCQPDVETWGQDIPVSADDLRPFYETLKSHFEKTTTRMATLTIPHDNC